MPQPQGVRGRPVLSLGHMDTPQVSILPQASWADGTGQIQEEMKLRGRQGLAERFGGHGEESDGMEATGQSEAE